MAFIRMMSGTKAGTKIDITQDETTIGRTADNSVPLEDSSSSSRHCSIIRDGNKYILRDLGSTNGTRLNEKSITEQRLKPKDLIMVGSTEIMFDGEDVEVDPSQAMPRTQQLLSVHDQVVATPSPQIGGDSPFNKKPETKNVWIGIIVFIGAITVVALIVFAFRLIMI